MTSFTWALLSVERKALERMADHTFLLSRLEHPHLSTESKIHQLTNPLRAGQPHRCLEVPETWLDALLLPP